MIQLPRKAVKKEKKLETYYKPKSKIPLWLIVVLVVGGLTALSRLLSSDTTNQDYMNVKVENPPDLPDYFAEEGQSVSNNGEDYDSATNLIEMFTSSPNYFVIFGAIIIGLPILLIFTRSLRRW